jgi:Zn-dependent protease
MIERGSFLFFTFQGIPVRVHWSFGLLIFWVWYIGNNAGMDWPAIGVLGLLILSLFACVIMHEFGHALAARRYGVHTRDIILSPIGGVARLDRIPEKPVQELVVALAGPMVNVFIAALLGVIAWIWLPGQLNILGESETAVFWIGNYVPLLFWMNISLVVFNMIPAFPMDGGRVLRALLAIRMGRLKATRWASIIGRIIATVFMVTALFQQELFLGLIGLFVYIMAGQEYKMVRADQLYKRFFVGQIVRRQFSLVHPHQTVADALQLIHHGLETNLLVGVERNKIDGYISAPDLIKARDKGHEETPVIHFIRPISGAVQLDTPLSNAFIFFQQDIHAFLIVHNAHGEIEGVLDRDQIDHVLYWSNRGKSIAT